MISLDLYGDPVAKVRHRTVRRGSFTSTYDPQEKIKEGYKWQVRSLYRNEPLKGPLFIDFTFFMPIPKSTSKKRLRAMLNGSIKHISRPDVDNIQKFYADVMNEIVYEDDSQIVEIRARKVYSDKPGTNIRIIALNSLEGEESNENSERIRQ